MALKIIFWQILIHVIICNGQANLDQFTVPLNHINDVHLNWTVNIDTIEFKVILKNKSLPLIFGFGFSDYGEFKDADFVLIEVMNEMTTPTLVDCYTDSDGALIRDKKSDYYFLNHKVSVEVIEISFKRKIDTCDKNDYYIDSGTTHILHFAFFEANFFINSFFDSEFAFYPYKTFNITDHMIRTQLIKSNLITNKFEKEILKSNYFDVVNHDESIPKTDTTYWCKTYKLDEKFNKKHHIVAFEGIIDKRNEGVVHHMELFHCVKEPSKNYKNFNNVCTSEEKPGDLKACRKVIAAWAMGAKTFIYPENVGGLLGGENYSMYLVLEIHYDNPNLLSNIIDSSGMRIYYTNVLRKHDAGIMEVGLEYKPNNSIPPKVSAFNLHGYCLRDCTNESIQKEITVFASQLHTHLTGRKVWTSVIRRNQYLSILNSDYHYSPHFQEIRMLAKPIKIWPGDVIINTCEYDTRIRDNMTFGGYGIRDEMCVNYMHYYPVVELELCKSSIRDDALSEYFSAMNTLDNANTTKTLSIEENYNRIRWTLLTAKLLNKFYNNAPISFSCNSSNGNNILYDKGYDMNKYKAFEMPINDFGQSQRNCLLDDSLFD